MQKELQEKYKDRWEPVSPETGKNKLLWMIGEVGEVIDIINRLLCAVQHKFTTDSDFSQISPYNHAQFPQL